jgi:hypothetical protein
MTARREEVMPSSAPSAAGELMTGMDEKIRLYELLVDQLTKYNAIFWQAPALVVANVAVLDKLSPMVIVGLGVFNGAMIYAFGRMNARQTEITKATERAEQVLKQAHPDFLPTFKRSPASARLVLVLTMSTLDLWLLTYALVRVFRG